MHTLISVFLAIVAALAVVPFEEMQGGSSSRQSLVRRVYDLWFGGNPPLDKPIAETFTKLWFGSDAKTDETIRTMFRGDLEKLESNAGGSYDSLLEDANVQSLCLFHHILDRVLWPA